MMSEEQKAAWIVISRLYFKKYNRFLAYCPIGLQPMATEFGVSGVSLRYQGKNVYVFEPPENFVICEKIELRHLEIIKNHKEFIKNIIMTIGSYYKAEESSVLSDYEGWLLEYILQINIGKYLIINYIKNHD